jgi:hypothetical protein
VGQHTHDATLLGLSPDGRTLVVKGRLYRQQKGKGIAVRVGSATDWVQLVEVATGKVRHTLPALDWVGEIDFTPDGRHLITSHGDGTALVWDVCALAGRYLNGVWDDLGSGDAGSGFAAICALAAAPRQAIRILGQTLRPAGVDAERVRRWIAELGSDSFEARQQAEKQLKALGADVEGDLQKATATTDLERRAAAAGETHRERTGFPATPATNAGAGGAGTHRHTRGREVAETTGERAPGEPVDARGEGDAGPNAAKAVNRKPRCHPPGVLTVVELRRMMIGEKRRRGTNCRDEPQTRSGLCAGGERRSQACHGRPGLLLGRRSRRLFRTGAPCGGPDGA